MFSSSRFRHWLGGRPSGRYRGLYLAFGRGKLYYQTTLLLFRLTLYFATQLVALRDGDRAGIGMLVYRLKNGSIQIRQSFNGA